MKKQNIGNAAVLLAAVAIWVGACTSAQASLVFTGTGVNAGSGTVLGGIATFTVTGNQLKLVLVNTGDAARVNSDVMTGVFFNWAGVNLTADSASSPTMLHYPESGPGSNPANTLGGGWAYNSSGNGTTGLSIWGSGDDFFTTDGSQNTPPLDGIDYGIVSGIAGTASGQVLTAPLAEPSVTFNFTIVTAGADLATLTFTGFNYGTSPSDQTIVPVPEPTTMIAGALLLLPFGASTIRFFRKNRAA